jgi:hypothetical protein
VVDLQDEGSKADNTSEAGAGEGSGLTGTGSGDGVDGGLNRGGGDLNDGGVGGRGRGRVNLRGAVDGMLAT